MAGLTQRSSLRAELRLRFGGDRLRGWVDWPTVQPGARASHVLLFVDAPVSPAAENLGVDLSAVAASVVVTLPIRSERPAGNAEFEALGWMAEHAEEFGGCPQRLAVAGLGTGGARAARLAIQSRDHGWPPLHHQLLVHPTFGAGWMLPADLSRMPAASIVTVSPDASASGYAALLRAAGVEVEERVDGGVAPRLELLDLLRECLVAAAGAAQPLCNSIRKERQA